MADAHTEPTEPVGTRPQRRWLGILVLLFGAILFIFPFYYMIVGSLQLEPNSDISGAFPSPGELSLDNFTAIDEAIDLGRTLLNSGIFTGGVILATLIGGLLAGWALAQLEFRGRDTLFNVMLLLLIVPFMLLMIPLYILIVRYYGLGDTYIGMILPFAINPTAVFIFRQFFKQLPRDLFDAARIDGANELQVLLRVGIPLAKPAILTGIVVTFIGPWNEFLWPFLVTKEQDMQPLAVSLGNYISTVAGREPNAFGTILAGAVVLALPAVLLFVAVQRHFVQAQIGSATKG